MKLLVHFYQHLLLVLLGLMLFATEKAAAGITYGKLTASTEDPASGYVILDSTLPEKPARSTHGKFETSTEDPASGYVILDSTLPEKPARSTHGNFEPSIEDLATEEGDGNGNGKEAGYKKLSADIIPGGCAIIDSTATEKAAVGIAHGKLTPSTEDRPTEEGDGNGNGKEAGYKKLPSTEDLASDYVMLDSTSADTGPDGLIYNKSLNRARHR
eukprot:GHVS01050395.1.p1 GENE.GHVS01050395.1~~GHVS01050395.1.p1  ORF type:complete len:214 (+),score=39.95 GHVS01050395.1:238-879(+)